MSKKTVSNLFFLICCCLFFDGCSYEVEHIINLESLRSSGDDWKIVVQDTLPDGGSIKLNHDHWLMYFLHWRPLTEENEHISIAYAKERMLNFWGPDMPFTITSEGGEMEVAGHRAFFIDGSFSNGIVLTRFIVWNCPETRRQFIADCNINKQLATNDSLLELQYEITSTISCHGGEPISNNPLLTNQYSSDEYNLSFYTPNHWRTDAYPETRWFPDGSTSTNGSLWTLLTDSDKYIDIMWTHGKRDVTDKSIMEFLDGFGCSSWDFEGVTYTVSDHEVNRIDRTGKVVIGYGSYKMNYHYQRQKGGERFVFRAYLKNDRNRTCFLLVSIVSKDTWWNRSVDLAPTDEVFHRFLRDEVFPNVSSFRRGIHPMKTRIDRTED